MSKKKYVLRFNVHFNDGHLVHEFDHEPTEAEVKGVLAKTSVDDLISACGPPEIDDVWDVYEEEGGKSPEWV